MNDRELEAMLEALIHKIDVQNTILTECYCSFFILVVSSHITCLRVTNRYSTRIISVQIFRSVRIFFTSYIDFRFFVSYNSNNIWR